MISGLFKSRKLGCVFLDTLINERISVFFEQSYQRVDIAASYVGRQGGFEPDAQYKYFSRVKPVDAVDKSASDVYVIYFPSKWASAIDKLLGKIKKVVHQDGLVVIVEVSKDDCGYDMCHWGDQLKTMWSGQCVVDHMHYQGNIGWLRESHLMIGLLWQPQSLQQISLNNLVHY